MSELRFELAPHSPYSPYGSQRLSSVSDQKKYLGGKRFSSNSKVIAAVNSYIEVLDSSSYNKGLANLE